MLAQHFLRKYAAENGREITGFTDEALSALMSYAWPGNVRELENAMERAVVLCRADRIGPDDLPAALRERGQGRKFVSFEVGTPLKVVERRMIDETLRYCHGDRSLAANLMGISARTIYRREAEDE